MKLQKNKQESVPVYNVLLVDEDTAELDLYSRLIRQVVNCNIDVMSRPNNFIDWIEKSNYHLIVISESGLELELLERIKRVSPSTSVILVSAEATIERAVSAIRMGAEDYLAKPLKVSSFKMSIKRGLDRKSVFEKNSSVANFLDLLNSCQMISGSLELSKILEIVESYLVRELNAGYSAVFTLKDGQPTRVGNLGESENFDKTLEEILEIALSSSKSLFSMISTTDFFRFIDKGPLAPGIFIFRFKCIGELEYFCICLSPERPEVIESFESRLHLLKAQIEVTGRSIEQYNGVQQLVYVDDATGLYNTRYLNYILEREIAQIKVSRKSFAVLFIDADHFKSINDLFGHRIGTRLLNELGNHFKKYVREKDTVFRYGGDEFVAVLSACDLPTAQAVAERIRASVEKKIFLKGEKLNINFTISIGVALFPEHAKTKKEIIEVADQAMYAAKRISRNRVSIMGSEAILGDQSQAASDGRK